MFYRGLKHEVYLSVFRPDKTLAASFLNGLKNIPQRACPSGLKTMVQIEVNISIQENKLCLISILYINNTNEECFIRI